MLASWRFVGLAVFAAIPAKIILTGFLFYAVPLYLSRLGVSQAETGRIMMLYSLVIVFAGPWLSRFSDRNGYGRWMVFAGTLGAGLAMMILWGGRTISASSPPCSSWPWRMLPRSRPRSRSCRKSPARDREGRRDHRPFDLAHGRADRQRHRTDPGCCPGDQFGFVEGLTVVGAYLVVLSLLLLTTYAGLPRGAVNEHDGQTRLKRILGILFVASRPRHLSARGRESRRRPPTG